ncbi:MAG: GTP-binding protein [Prevotellaceae bacterium]|nr:GTP-binding protein [Prevotellaceae bacterium]
MNHTLPVLLLTGYLGSGKTTLLNRILRNERGIRFAVIVNDLGEVNIDASLIQQGGVVSQSDDSLVALQNGCICCTLKMDLVEQLHDITSSGRFDYIVIEASGICEPGPIAQTICSIPSLDERYTSGSLPELDCIATVVDALRLRDEFKGGLDLLEQGIGEEDIDGLVIQQIEFCNIILLNKASEVSKEELQRTTEVLRTLQPHAEIVPCDYCDVPLEKLLHTRLFDFEQTATSATWVEELEGHDHDHEEEGEAEEYGISTFVYTSRKPMSLSRFDYFVARRWPQGVIRTKGICYFKGEEQTCYLFEQAGKQVSLKNAGQWYATMPEEELKQFLKRNPSVAQDWDEHYGDRMQKIVFIGQSLDRQLITTELNRCLEEQ